MFRVQVRFSILLVLFHFSNLACGSQQHIEHIQKLNELQELYSKRFLQEPHDAVSLNSTLAKMFVEHAGAVGYGFMDKTAKDIPHHIYFETYQKLTFQYSYLFFRRLLLSNSTWFKLVKFNHSSEYNRQQITLNLNDVVLTGEWEQAGFNYYNPMKLKLMPNSKGYLRIRMKELTYAALTILEPIADVALRVRDIVSGFHASKGDIAVEEIDSEGNFKKTFKLAPTSEENTSNIPGELNPVMIQLREALDRWLTLYMNYLMEQYVYLPSLIYEGSSMAEPLSFISRRMNQEYDTLMSLYQDDIMSNVLPLESEDQLEQFQIEHPKGAKISFHNGFISGLETLTRLSGTSGVPDPNIINRKILTCKYGSPKLKVILDYSAKLPNSLAPLSGSVIIDLSAMRLRISLTLDHLSMVWIEAIEVITPGEYVTVTGQLGRYMSGIRHMVVNQVSAIIESHFREKVSINAPARDQREHVRSIRSILETQGINLNDYPIPPSNSSGLKENVQKLIHQIDYMLRHHARGELLTGLLNEMKEKALQMVKYTEKMNTKLSVISLVSRLEELSDKISNLNEVMGTRQSGYSGRRDNSSDVKETINEMLINIANSTQDAEVLLKAFKLVKYADRILCLLWSGGIDEKQWKRSSNIIHQLASNTKEHANEILEMMIAKGLEVKAKMLETTDYILETSTQMQRETYFLRAHPDFKCIIEHIESRARSLKYFLVANKCSDGTQFPCNTQGSGCISFDKYCDKTEDCPGKTDERYCDYGYIDCKKFDHISCSTAKCIDIGPGCKCERNCREKWSTSTTTKRPREATTSTHKRITRPADTTTGIVVNITTPEHPTKEESCHGYHCVPSGPCIDSYKICDGINDCPNRDDEQNCDIPTVVHEDTTTSLVDTTRRPVDTTTRPVNTTTHPLDTTTSHIDTTTGPGKRTTSSVGNTTTPEHPTKEESCHGYHCVPSGPCIDSYKICDGINDCPNRDDEQNCDITTVAHEDTTTSLIDTTRRPVHATTRPVDTTTHPVDTTTSHIDTTTGPGKRTTSSVGNTTTEQHSTEAPCYGYNCEPDGPCIELFKRCDGKNDCPYGDDENNCGNTSGYTVINPGDNITGPRGQTTEATPCRGFQCQPDGPCIAHSKTCDGIINCPHGDDEMDCFIKPGSPSNFTIFCKKFICNKDCKPGDEFKKKECACWMTKCCVREMLKGSMTCDDGTCFNEEAICHGHYNRNCKENAALRSCDAGVCNPSWDMDYLRDSSMKFLRSVAKNINKLKHPHTKLTKLRTAGYLWRPVINESKFLRSLPSSLRSGNVQLKLQLKDTATRMIDLVKDVIQKFERKGINIDKRSRRFLDSVDLGLSNIKRCAI